VSDIRIAPAREEDVPVVLRLIRALGEYEKLSDQVVASEADIHDAIFGPRPFAEVVLAFADDTPVGFALFFHNFSTFLGRPGLYLEDLFVVPEWRGRGVGRRLLTHLAGIAVARGCGRLEWAVLDWNESAIGFYRRLGASLMDEWRLCRLTGESLARAAAGN
jgi:GNAT superfamily N-acetyltransferase